jgi:hypothetical protein
MMKRRRMVVVKKKEKKKQQQLLLLLLNKVYFVPSAVSIENNQNVKFIKATARS